jgi:hypothetical protein
MWKLVSDIKGGTQTEGVWEQLYSSTALVLHIQIQYPKFCVLCVLYNTRQWKMEMIQIASKNSIVMLAYCFKIHNYQVQQQKYGTISE